MSETHRTAGHVMRHYLGVQSGLTEVGHIPSQVRPYVSHEPWAKKDFFYYPMADPIRRGELGIILLEGFTLREGFANIRQSYMPRSGTRYYGGNVPF